ncbi:hypothetical protein [Argonema galeatum]|uniref:hypothetical protein n=1 Tax=Argonema galeatum TaxID=2942762 RepID=UPI002011FFE0|nr:hypothetical protein [Argonema galeatum]MCL1468282.1 hypothetical protein [Argonema galeatum A003/A1]
MPYPNSIGRGGSIDRRSPIPTPQFVEAQGWIIGSNEEVILTASSPTITPHASPLTPASCRS